MKNKKIIPGVQALLMSGFVLFFIACNNGDYTKSSASDSGTDTTMKTSPAGTDTASSNSTTANKKAATPGKKGKATLGAMTMKKGSIKPDKNGVYEVTDVSPAYPGGQSAMEDYVNNNIDLQNAADNNAQGTVDVQFIVDENGNVKDAKPIGKKLGNGLDEAAVQVVSNMPKWEPGKVKGKDVKTKVVLPITYNVQQ